MEAVGKSPANLRVVSPLCAPTSHISFIVEELNLSRSYLRSVPLGREFRYSLELVSFSKSFLVKTFIV
jgi:hypothetical protein